MNDAMKRMRLVPALAVMSWTVGCQLPTNLLEGGGEENDEADSWAGSESEESGGVPAQEVLECKIGTNKQSLGTQAGLWQTSCEVECATGWGHISWDFNDVGPLLEIEWTRVALEEAEEGFGLVGLAALDNDEYRVILGHEDGTTRTYAYGPDGDLLDVSQFGSVVDIPARPTTMASRGAELFVGYNRTGELGGYVARVDALGAPGWSRSYESEHIYAVAAAPIGVAVLLMGELETRVELLDADGELIWESEVMSAATDLEFGPAPTMNLAVGASQRRVEMFDSGSGELSWSTAALEDMDYWNNGMAFIGQEQLVLLDSHVDISTTKFDANISAHDQGGQLWGETYNRAELWCPDDDDLNSTAEAFLDVATLDDGSILVAGSEAFMEGAQVFRQGWVGHVSAQGEFLGFDRRLWNGVPMASAAGSDNSGLVLSSELNDVGDEVGFSLRKYSF